VTTSVNLAPNSERYSCHMVILHTCMDVIAMGICMDMDTIATMCVSHYACLSLPSSSDGHSRGS
jgi:hypothetical protein